MHIYLVGGAVRDRLLHRKVRDKDYVVLGADREHFLRRFPTACEVGKTTSVYYVHGDEYTLSAAESIEQDLLARDLTINALAMDTEGNIIAHPRAREHLADKILYPVSEDSFFDDPARVFRAARFSACLPDFFVHPRVINQMQRVARRRLTDTLSAERVGQELCKSLSCPVPSRFLTILDQGSCLEPWFEECARAASIPAGPLPYHDESVLEHTCVVMDRLAGTSLHVWMGLCHDLGKVLTDPARWPHHHGHDCLGEGLALRFGNRLRLPAKMITAGVIAARWHMTAARYEALRPGTRVDFLTRVGSLEMLKGLCALVRADGGRDVAAHAEHDWEVVHRVHLPEKWKGLGAQSGEHLRMLRAQALARSG